MVAVAAGAVEPRRGLVVALDAGDELLHTLIGCPRLSRLRQGRTEAEAAGLLYDNKMQVSAEKRLQALVRRWLRVQRDLGQAKHDATLDADEHHRTGVVLGQALDEVLPHLLRVGHAVHHRVQEGVNAAVVRRSSTRASTSSGRAGRTRGSPPRHDSVTAASTPGRRSGRRSPIDTSQASRPSAVGGRGSG